MSSPFLLQRNKPQDPARLLCTVIEMHRDFIIWYVNKTNTIFHYNCFLIVLQHVVKKTILEITCIVSLHRMECVYVCVCLYVKNELEPVGTPFFLINSVCCACVCVCVYRVPCAVESVYLAWSKLPKKIVRSSAESLSFFIFWCPKVFPHPISTIRKESRRH